MNQAVEPTAVSTPTESDVVAAIQRVLRESEEPLTEAKIRAQLPGALRPLNVEDALRRQAAANVLHVFPKYRSAHERYWDRPMPVHVTALVRTLLHDGALPLSELRRKLPAYAHALFEQIVNDELAAGRLFRHPRLTSRGSERLGLAQPEPREYLRPELVALFGRLQQLGFTPERLRQASLELLHEEEWATERETPAAKRETPTETAASADQPS